MTALLFMRMRGVAAVAALAGLALGWSVATDVLQATAPYATTYQYGTTGTVEAAQWLDTHLAPGETYVGAKELAIRTVDQRYVDQDTLLYFLDTGRGFDGEWQREPIRTVAAWKREQYVASLRERSLPALGYQA